MLPGYSLLEPLCEGRHEKDLGCHGMPQPAGTGTKGGVPGEEGQVSGKREKGGDEKGGN